ncbi:MAG: hypothetical protein HC900_00250 [Methylacidiphilales bacterium]|nr:hypothetical protein [Candidatus Methylacidiphilales bacterium]
MDIWHYDRETGELLGAGAADPDPERAGRWLHPAFSTTTAPPPKEPGRARVWAGEEWAQVADHRGETWWRSRGEPVVIGHLGDPAEAGLTPDEPPAPPPTLEGRRSALIAAVNAKADALLALGAPVVLGDRTLHVRLDDGSRSDLSAMGATAIAVAAGVASWPESYALGWITIENIRVPMPTLIDGLALAASAGDWYARIVQNRRDLKDAIAAAADDAELTAIDIDEGWPA